MKRFTETNKWRDCWYRKLPPLSKLLWQYLCDNCDHAGVIELDLEAASFDIGEPIKPEHVAALESRLQPLSNGKLWIRGFIAFQYGKLSRDCRPHNAVFEALDHHKLTVDGCVHHPTNAPKENSSQKALNTLSHTLANTLQDKTRLDKDKDKDQERGGVGEIPVKPPNGSAVEIHKPTPIDLLWEKVCVLYKRPKPVTRSYAEESALAEVCRRADALSEFCEIESYFKRLPKKDHQFFPSSSRLFENWQQTLDRARLYHPAGNSKTI